MANQQFPDRSYQGAEKSETAERRKVEKVTTGNVQTRKKSEIRKFAGIFIPEDTESVKSYIWNDIVIPGIKNAIADVISIVLFGEPGRMSSSKRRNGGGTSYQRFYDDIRDRDRRDYAKPRNGYDFDDIFFERRADAEKVLDILDEMISDYGMVSVYELYEASGMDAPNYNARNYGWTDIHGAKAVRVRDGYILQLPKALPIT